MSHKSSAAYFICLSVFVWFLKDFIPAPILIPWILIHLNYQMLRFYYASKYKNKEFTPKDKIHFQKIHIILGFIGGSTWGVGSFLCVIYAPSPYEYIVLTLIIGMVAGAISTLSPLYRVYLAYNLPMSILLAASFFYQGDTIHVAIAFILVLFTVIVMSASWDVYQNLKRSVELKELYAQAQEELTQINASLEERICQAVDENRKKDKQMLEQSRLAQMGEMLSMIAHQWRQPLSAITASTGSMTLHMELEDKCDKEFIQENIDKVNNYTQYLSTTITDFRNFFKPDKEKTVTSLNEIVLGSLKIIGTSLQAQGIHIETFLESKEEFNSFPNELKQVVLNIFKNAQDAFIENGTKNPRILVKTISLDDFVELIISDNAGGISEDAKPYIFDPYFTTKEKRDGTGLGLYMSKMIVEDHCNGRVTVDNEEDGASFTLTLPLN